MPSSPEPKITKGHCPQCGRDRKAHIRGSHTTPSGEGGSSPGSVGLILECCGCERMYFRLDDIVDDWEPDRSSALPGEIVGKYGCRRSYWPPPKTRRPPPWIRDLERADDDLGILLHEMYAAINADLGVLAAIGVRTVFDRSSELLGVDPELRFGRKLDELVAQGRIGSDERRTLSVLIDAGSAAAHRGW